MRSELDRTDGAILRHLQEDGRAQLSDIAEQTGLSPPTIRRRLDRLLEEGTLREIIGIVEPEKVGLDVTAFIQMRVDRSTDYERFIEQVRAEPAVLEMHVITGGESHLLKVRTYTMDRLDALLSEISGWAGVKQADTDVVIRSLKETPQQPLEPSQIASRSNHGH
jgi:Lrp/AsnC family leucine-responsive transcriptional regulator